MEYFKMYIIAFIIFLAIDAIWLGLVAPKFYKEQIGHLMAEKPNFIAALVFYLILHSEGYSKRTFWGVLVFVTVLSVFFFALSGHFYDFSFDGQWYHQDAIILLKNGWNP